MTNDREVVVIERRGAEPIALISADELEGLMETAYLFSSPRNAERLLEALAQARRGEGTPQTVEELARELSLDDAAGGK